MEKIDIKIKDNRKFCYVAFFVDNPKIFRGISNLRKKWKVNKYKERLLKSKDWFDAWLDILLNEKIVNVTSFNPRKLLPNPDNSDIPLPDSVEKLLKVNKKQDKDRIQAHMFFYDVNLLRTEYKRSAYFIEILISAILINEVKEESVDLAYGEIIYSGEKQPVLDFLKMGIIFYPESTSKDILTAFEKSKERLMKEYSDYYIVDKTFSNATMSEIRLERNWYWERKTTGKTYREIAEKYIKENNISDFQDVYLQSEAIRKAVDRYAKRLSEQS